MYKLFRTPVHHLGASTEPDYLLREGLFFPTATHPRGWSEKADYELGTDGKIYRRPDHPLGAGMLPDYEIGPEEVCFFTVVFVKRRNYEASFLRNLRKIVELI